MPPELAQTHEFSYEYHYKDHLGNLRLAFRQATPIAPFYATLETERAEEEEAQYENIATSRDAQYSRTGSKAAKVNSSKVLGPWKTVYVKEGDKVEAQAFGYYPASGSTGNRVPLGVFIGNAPSQTPQVGNETGQNIFSNLQLGVSLGLSQPIVQSGVPVAYLKVLIYNKDYVLLSSRMQQLTSLASTSWQELRLSVTAPEEEYMQILVANESEKAVWFDDLKVSVVKDLIVQENHTDPFGLALARIEKCGEFSTMASRTIPLAQIGDLLPEVFYFQQPLSL